MRTDIQIWVLHHCKEIDKAGLTSRKAPKRHINLPTLLKWIESKADLDLAFNVLKEASGDTPARMPLEVLLQTAEEDYTLLTKPAEPEKPVKAPVPTKAKRKARATSKRSAKKY